MAESQPPTIVEGATTGDVDDEIPVAAKSAEDRKAAAALSSMDTRREEDAPNAREVDQEAVRKAMDRLTGSIVPNGTAPSKKEGEKTALAIKKNVKVDPVDVALLMEELEVTKAKATDLLRLQDGDASKALKAFIAV